MLKIPLDSFTFAQVHDQKYYTIIIYYITIILHTRSIGIGTYTNADVYYIVYT